MNNGIDHIQPKCAIAVANLDDGIDLASARLSPEIVNKAATLKAERRSQFLTGRWLLAELLFQTTAIKALPEIITSLNGRPSFTQSELPDFNISHSGNMIMVALSQGCQIGLDLELKRPRKKLLELAKYSFSDSEFCWLNSLKGELQVQAFWQLWTIRESTLKLAGKGVWQMKEIAIDPLNRSLTADFSRPLYCLSSQQRSLFWSITTNKMLNTDNISLWHASPDMISFERRPLPELILFQSNEN